MNFILILQDDDVVQHHTLINTYFLAATVYTSRLYSSVERPNMFKFDILCLIFVYENTEKCVEKEEKKRVFGKNGGAFRPMERRFHRETHWLRHESNQLTTKYHHLHQSKV